MTLIHDILARSEMDSTIKMIFGAVVVAFWLIGALVSAINKKAQENRRRESYGQLLPGLTPARQTPPEARLAQMVAPPVPQRRPAVKGPSYAAPATARIEAMPSSNLRNVAVATQVTHKQPATKVAPPDQIGRLLKRPDTLRAAFILNEVLTPPLSLREGPGGRGHT
jgi:hypothetical protein